jgi:tetratricopeptide (TPR) repeat protein
VNIHHFILDGAIWKLRDGRIASLLLNSRERIADAASQAGGNFAAAARWLAGSTTGARSLRIGTAMLLLAWGTVDQARYYFALHTDDLQDLQRAESLNSFDSSLQMRLANRAMEDGQTQQAEAAWKRAMQANPADPGARQALLRFLIDEKRFDEAASLTDASLRITPKDANLLVDRGFLAQRNRHPDQALANWSQALAVDSNQYMAHLFIADELDREGKAQEAASHYNAFLVKVSRPGSQERPAPDRVIAVVLRMADCQARSAQTGIALQSYQLAEKLAVQTHQPKLESVADVNEAGLQSKAGKLTEALRLYQEALQLDKSSGDDAAGATDWYIYGRFLDDSGFSARLAYACIVKSESLTRSLSNPSVPDEVTEARKQLENKLGAAAASVRRDPEPALQEALALRR